MKLAQIKEFVGTAQQFVDQVRKNLTTAGWSEGQDQRVQGSSFYVGRTQDGGTEFRVPVVNSRQGGAQPGQIDLRAFNAAIDGPYRAARSAGVAFSQPVGMSGSGWENDQVSGSVMQFTITDGQ